MPNKARSRLRKRRTMRGLQRLQRAKPSPTLQPMREQVHTQRRGQRKHRDGFAFRGWSRTMQR